MTTDEKLKLITRNLEEVLTEEELKALIDSETPLRHYIGFEISGKLHIGYLFTLMKVKDLQDAGAETIMWLADLHSAINDKLDGNLETIKRVARGYFTDALGALFQCIGGDPQKLKFMLCSETYAQNPSFWMTLLEIGKTTTLARTKRSITIMGREESDDSMPTDKLFYPIMQAADIFLLQANIAHAGIDQRKVHVVARDAAMQVKTQALEDSKGEQIKPVAIHHPILLSLSAPSTGNVSYSIDPSGVVTVTFNTLTEPVIIPTPKGNVMIPPGLTGKFKDTTNETNIKDVSEIAMRTKISKSKSGSGITIHDSPETIRSTISGAYAPEEQVDNNPILNWTKNLIFYGGERSLIVQRNKEHGGNITYNSYEELERDYAEKKLHPQDLKNAVAEWLIKKLEPARKYFEDPKRKTVLEEIEVFASSK